MCDQLNDLIAKLKEITSLLHVEGESSLISRFDTAVCLLYQEKRFGRTVNDLDPESLVGLCPETVRAIQDILRTGTCETRENLLKRHGHLLPLMAEKGIGPSHARFLYENGVTDPAEARTLVKNVRKKGMSLREFFRLNAENPKK